MNKQETTATKRTTTINSEKGFGTITAMLMCIAFFLLYLNGGNVLIQENLDPLYHFILIMSFGIMAIFTIGCSLQLALKGEKPNRRLQREIEEETKQLMEFVPEAMEQLTYLEEVARQCKASFRPRGQVSMDLAKRIVKAIDRRTKEVNNIDYTHGKFAVIDAYELLRSDLEIVENCVDTLIPGDPIPPLPREKWFSLVDQLLRDASSELEQAAA